MSRFGAIKTERSALGRAAVEDSSPPASRANGRIGKRAVSGYFSGDLSRALHMLAIEQETSLQALMGEAFDDLFRKYGKHPFGER